MEFPYIIYISIAIPRVLLDLGFEKKMFSQDLCFHTCTATSVDHLLKIL